MKRKLIFYSFDGVSPKKILIKRYEDEDEDEDYGMNGVNICDGDSGGPLTFEVKGRWEETESLHLNSKKPTLKTISLSNCCLRSRSF